MKSDTEKSASPRKNGETMNHKISIRFFDDREVRAVWDDARAKWFFSVIDIVGVLRDETDYTKNRNYWKYLKAKLKREGNEVGSATTHLKLRAPDGKKYSTNVLDYDGIIALAKAFPWLTRVAECFCRFSQSCSFLFMRNGYSWFRQNSLCPVAKSH